MRIIKIILVGIISIAGLTQINSQDSYCPYYVECYTSGNNNELRLYFNVGLDELGPSPEVSFYEGSSVTGPIQATSSSGTATSSMLTFAIDCNSNFTGDVIVESGEATSICIIKNGQLEHNVGQKQECDAWIAECDYQIQTLISDAVDDGDIQVNGCDLWEGDCGPDGNIWRSGSLVIGSSTIPNPNKYKFKLGVQGKIITEQFKVCPNSWGWCDYVFYPDYDLMNLSEVENFIESKGHLPATPSAKTIEQDGGFHLDKVALNHQEKIEEIFLHLISLNRKAETLLNY